MSTSDAADVRSGETRWKKSGKLVARVIAGTVSSVRLQGKEREGTHAMWKHASRARWVGAWCAAVAVISACSVVAGVTMSIRTGALLLVTALAPPALMTLVWRGPPTITVAKLLCLVYGPPAEDPP